MKAQNLLSNRVLQALIITVLFFIAIFAFVFLKPTNVVAETTNTTSEHVVTVVVSPGLIEE